MSGSEEMDETIANTWVLDSIDQLRKRKARPDLDRICHMISRKYGLSAIETRAHLYRLVDSGVVMKVEYKGNISYRNAAKWRKTHGHIVGGSSATLSPKQSLFLAVKSITSRGDDDEENDSYDDEIGASLSEIEEWVIAYGDEKLANKDKLSSCIQKEIVSGRLNLLGNGNYAVPSVLPGPRKKRAKKSSKSDASASTAPSPAEDEPPSIPPPPSQTPPPTDAVPVDGDLENGSSGWSTKAGISQSGGSASSSLTSRSRGRPFKIKRRKRIKKSHGPDFVELYKFQHIHDEKCDYCLNTSEHNPRGTPESLLICKDCNAKAHPSCMDYSDDLAIRARNSPWQCIDCKTCYVCEDSGDPDAMLFCDACDKGYHMSCHNPPIQDKPLGKWVCGKCILENMMKIKVELNGEVNNNNSSQSASPSASFLPTPCESPTDDVKPLNGHGNNDGSLQRNLKTVEHDAPDASDWTIDDVVMFFRSVGFSDQAEAFQEQEIDGKSLLLMKRSDVLTGLSLKLGPALKIYQYVQKLQTSGHL